MNDTATPNGSSAVERHVNSTVKTESLTMLATSLIVSKRPSLAGRVSVKIVIFDRDWHYSVSRDRLDINHCNIRLYVSEKSDPTQFTKTVIAAAKAASDLFNDEIRVPVQAMLSIRHLSPEIDAILTSKGY